ncbi:LysR family transcriptional regulator [Hasllibacter sp. MH4015]|uniref:LysR family transcriptional regulator n=1 Tax=Hasllibacter sp. MH4015 TaxID=2854029 RepID=UPI001CD7B7CD|nr:LysR family transcriptional regulator [Hasllibacter sp. MH4015]
MRTDTLKAFQTVVELGSLSSAARALNLSEPALSRRIQALEAELDLVLFDRSRRQLRPTEAGQAFLQEVQPILSGLNRISDFANDIRTGARRRLRLVSMPRLGAAITAPVVARFKASHPDVALSVDIQPRRFLETWITGQRFDIGLSSLPARHRDIDTRLLFELPAVAVLPVGHRLADAPSLSVEDLLAEDNFLTLGSGTLLRQQTETIFGHANAMLRPRLEVSQAHLACHLVALGAGVTICDPLVPTGFPEQLATVPIVPHYPMAFGMHFLRGHTLSDEALTLEGIVRARADEFIEELGITP